MPSNESSNLNSTCIYCLVNDARFTDEHVIPQAFGKFQDNLVLNGEVCGDCNQCFGNNLDRILARASQPGVARYMLGYRPATELNKRDHERVKMFVSEGPLRIPLDFVTVDGQAAASTKSGIKYWSTETNSLRFVTSEDISTGREKLEDVDESKDVELLPDETGLERLLAALSDLGVSVGIHGVEPSQEGIAQTQVPINVEIREDEIIYRGMAKIAFNYLAKICGGAFVLSAGFNEIRNYIRFGEQGQSVKVEQIKPPTTLEGKYFPAERNGHLVRFDQVGRPPFFQGMVVLSGSIPYKVFLGRTGELITTPIASGHYFDVNKKVVELA